MAVELKIPESGESITEVQVSQWRKSEGDRVEVDEVLVEIETDKAAMDLPAPVSGVLSKILKKDGEEAAVGEVIAYIDESGDGAGAAPPSGKDAEPGKRAAKPEEKPEKKPAASARKEQEPASKPVSKEEPRKQKAAEAEEAPAPKPELVQKEPRVTPAARRVLEEHGLEASEVEATGPGGRLLKEDVLRHLEAKAREEGPREPEEAEAEPARAEEAAVEPAEAPGPAEARPERQEQIVPMSPMRRVIAKNLVVAQQNAALLTTFNEIDMSEVIALRKQHQEAFSKKYGVKLGFMSFFVKASVEALKHFPAVNTEIRGNDIVYKNYYDIGIAVGGGKGLVVPVVRNAERMSFAEIEMAIADLAARAQKNEIELSELKGGTFTISNGGIYGSMLSTPIVNPPQSGILGLHAIQERPAARDGQLVILPMMYVALTYDHRIVDGREAVSFLRHIKEVIEEPVRILIEI